MQIQILSENKIVKERWLFLKFTVDNVVQDQDSLFIIDEDSIACVEVEYLHFTP